MKKNYRQEAIISIVEKNEISTQEQLQEKLKQLGFDVTQATVSRDIKALNLIKVQDKSGHYRYAVTRDEKEGSKKLSAIISHSVIGTDFAGSITVIHCYSGMAGAACASIDSLKYGNILGTVAGDDTIFVLNRTEEDAEKLAKEIESVLTRI